MTWWEAFLLGIANIFFLRLTLAAFGLEIKKKNPYKFKCPLCTFQVSGNDQSLHHPH